MKNFAYLLFGISAILIIYGFIVMFHYGDYDPESLFDTGSKFGHIVGGDAYNYIIIGIRGLGFIVTGFIATVVAAAILILDQLKVNATIYKSASESSGHSNEIGLRTELNMET